MPTIIDGIVAVEKLQRIKVFFNNIIFTILDWSKNVLFTNLLISKMFLKKYLIYTHIKEVADIYKKIWTCMMGPLLIGRLRKGPFIINLCFFSCRIVLGPWAALILRGCGM